jgi:REP element-mobilizing transposase RayT
MYNPKIHHRRSIRLRDFDYSSNGAYFVTICTQNREFLFGNILGGEMTLNGAGWMLTEFWLKLADKFIGISLDEFIIMPNHFHGIICINNPDFVAANPNGCLDDPDSVGADPCVCPPLTFDDGTHMVDVPNKGAHMGTHMADVPNMGAHMGAPLHRMVQWFKTMTTNTYIRGVKQSGWSPFPGRLWQRDYYERVMRDGREMTGIREYIVANPMRWNEDKENPGSTGI